MRDERKRSKVRNGRDRRCSLRVILDEIANDWFLRRLSYIGWLNVQSRLHLEGVISQSNAVKITKNFFVPGVNALVNFGKSVGEKFVGKDLVEKGA